MAMAGMEEGRGAGARVLPNQHGQTAMPATSGTSSQRAAESRRDIKAMALRVAAQPLPIARQDLWGLLTAVSDKARKRPQGFHIMLHSPEHVLGRNVKEASCQFESPNVSGKHCTIFRRILRSDGRTIPLSHIPGPNDRVVTFIKDSSSNGTFINQQKLQRNGDEVQLRHGDIVSLVGVPEHENAFAFVYREVLEPAIGSGPPASFQPSGPAGQLHKRKGSSPDDTGEAVGGDGKRVRGLGSGGHDGPVCLNDVRQLQRSNEELREQLETHMLNFEKLRAEYRTAEAHHASELKEIRTALSEKFTTQLEELRVSLSEKEQELEASSALGVHQESTIEVLKQRLASAARSRTDAEEVIDSLKGRVDELEKLLEEERVKNSTERADAEASLKAALERVQLEASEELKRHNEAAARQQEQQTGIILALQDGEKQNRLLAEISRKKLDSERAAVVAAEEKIRGLESQLQEERNTCVNAFNRAADMEEKFRKACIELEGEKAAREIAQAKVTSLELEMEAVIGDLKLEKQRLQGAQERIVLRETQLRAFHSTAAEIAELQQRQQDQLAMMIRTLEDGDSDNDQHDARARSTSPSTKVHPGPTDYDNRYKYEVGDERRIGASHSRSGSRPMQVDTDAQPSQKQTPCRLHEDLKGQDDDRSKDTTFNECMDGDTQQDDCSIAPDLSMSPEPPVLPTQITPSADLQGSLCNKQNSSPTNVEVGYTQLVTVEAGYTQLTTAEANVDNGFTQLMTADCGYTQLLEFGGGSKGATVPGNGGREGNNGAYTLAQGKSEASEEDPVGPIIMDEEDREVQQQPRTDSVVVSKNIERWNSSVGEGQRDYVGAEVTEARVLETVSEGRRGPRDSLCTADLLASEVAGSWAVGTPASAHGENDSSSDERGSGKEERNCRISDEGADYAVSQVATNNLAAGKHTDDSVAGNETKVVNNVDVNVDVEVGLSQTSAKSSTPKLEPQRLQEHQALNEMLSIVAPEFGNFQNRGRHDATNVKYIRDDSIDTSSTEDDSREEGEIGASELRDSEPSMYV